MTKLRIYTGWLKHNGQQAQAIVSAYSIQEAARIADVTPYDIRTYWLETGNQEDIQLALQNPQTLIWRG